MSVLKTNNGEKESKRYIQWEKEFHQIIMSFKKIISEYDTNNKSKDIVITYKNDKNEEKIISRKIIFTHLKENKDDEVIPIYILSGIEQIPINKIISISVKDHIIKTI